MLPRACKASSSLLAPAVGSLGVTPILVSLGHRSTRQLGSSIVARGKAPLRANLFTRGHGSVAAVAREDAIVTAEAIEPRRAANEDPSVGQYRHLLSTDAPYDALLSLPSLPPAELDALSCEDIERLLITLGEIPPTIPKLWPQEALRIAMGWLGRHTLASTSHLKYRDRRPRLVKLYTQALARCGLYPTLLAFLKGEKRAVRSPDVLPLVAEMTRAKEWRVVLALSSGNFSSSPPPFSAELAAHRMKAFLHLQRYNLVLTEYDKHHEYHIDPLLEGQFHLLQTHLLRRDLASARTVLADLKSSGHADLNTQQLAILHGYRSLGFDFDIERQVLKDISNLKLLPPTDFLNGLLRLRIDAGDRIGAMAILRQFDLRAVSAYSSRPSDTPRPNLETLGSILGLCNTDEDLRLSHRFWTELKPTEPESTGNLVYALIRALIRNGLVDDAFNLLLINAPAPSIWSLPEGFVPFARHFNPVLKALSERDGIAGIRKVMALMKVRSVVPDNTTVLHLAEFARKVTRASTGDVEALIASLRSTSPLLIPTVEQLDLLVSDAVSLASQDANRPLTSQSRERIKVYKAVPEFNEASSTPDAALGLDALSAFRRVMRLSLASLDDRRMKATAKAFASRLRFDATVIRDLPAANRILELMLARGFRPEPMHFAALMQGYAAVGAMHLAEDTLALARDAGIRPNAVMLTILIDGYGRRRKLDRSLAMFRKFAKLGITPDHAAVTAVIHAYHRAGQHTTAVDFAKEHLPQVAFADRAAVTMAGYARLAAGSDLTGLLDDAEAASVPFDRPLRRMVVKARNRLRKSAETEDLCDTDAAALRRADAILEADTKAKKRTARGVEATKKELASLMRETVDGKSKKRTRGGKKVRAMREGKARVKAAKAEAKVMEESRRTNRDEE